jgi:hypothetical protein
VRTIQTPNEFQPLGRRGVLVQELEVIDGERLDVDISNRPSIGRKSLQIRHDQIDIGRPPLGKLLSGVQPCKQTFKFADVTGAVFD